MCLWGVPVNTIYIAKKIFLIGDLSQYHLTLNTICPRSMNKSKIIKTIKPLLIPKAVHVTENTFEENLLICLAHLTPKWSSELLSPLSVRRPSVNFSHFNQLL